MGRLSFHHNRCHVMIHFLCEKKVGSTLESAYYESEEVGLMSDRNQDILRQLIKQRSMQE